MMRSLAQEIQSALEFLQACPELLLSSGLTPSRFAILDHETLAAMAGKCGYDFGAEALSEAFRIRMLARLLSQQRA